jgi:hypothetical protein
MTSGSPCQGDMVIDALRARRVPGSHSMWWSAKRMWARPLVSPHVASSGPDSTGTMVALS